MSKRVLVIAAVTAALALSVGCKAAEEITPGPTPKPATPQVLVKNELVPEEHYVEVSGYGEVNAAADFATITLTVQGAAETAELAGAHCEENRASVYDVSQTLGVDPKDITSAGATITPQQRETDGAITGYVAVDTITIIVSDAGTANAVMSGIIDASAGKLVSITYSLTDSSTAYQNALDAAMDDALIKAQTIATAGGVELGPVVGAIETPHDDSTLVGVAFENSAIAVSARVTVKYLIK